MRRAVRHHRSLLERLMDADEYRTAIAALGLSQQAAGRALEVSRRTAHNFAVQGPSGPAAVAIRGMLKIAAYEALMRPAQPPMCEMGTAKYIWGGDSGSPLPFLNDDKAFIEKVDAE